MMHRRYIIVVPAFNEEASLPRTVTALSREFADEHDVGILVVDNQSTDSTFQVAEKLVTKFDNVGVIKSEQKQGYGVAIQSGIKFTDSEYLVFAMADGSESPRDVRRFIEASRSNPEACIFGNRFSKQSKVSGYPLHKLVLNRLANALIGIAIKSSYRDFTNGFKLYPRSILQRLQISRNDFSITVELSVGAVASGARFVVLDHDWIGREQGESSFNLARLALPYLSALFRTIRRNA